MNLFNMFQASRGIPVSDPLAMLWGYQHRKMSGDFAEISGVPPLNFISRGEYLLDYRIYGNTVQDGTPTPENPVAVQGCGERTENLFGVKDKSLRIGKTIYKISDGVVSKEGTAETAGGQDAITLYGDITRISNYPNYASIYRSHSVLLEPGTYYFGYNGQSDDGNRVVLIIGESGQAVYRNDGAMMILKGRHFTIDTAKYCMPLCNVSNGIEYSSFSNIMLIKSSTPPDHYIPYGYKIPVTVSNEVLTEEPLRAIGDYKDTLDLAAGIVTRRIGKYTLTGNEGFVYNGGSSRFLFYTRTNFLPLRLNNKDLRCSHAPLYNYFPEPEVPYVRFHDNGTIYVDFGEDGGFDKNSIRDYLVKQSSEGTPVTIWYVLKTPTTETISVPEGLTGIVEGYSVYNGTPSPQNPVYPEENSMKKTVTPVYIGSEPLYSGEYVSFKKQKIYRFIDGVLTPVSAELPAIPTFEGENILTVGTEIQPSEVYLKYQKG